MPTTFRPYQPDQGLLLPSGTLPCAAPSMRCRVSQPSPMRTRAGRRRS